MSIFESRDGFVQLDDDGHPILSGTTTPSPATPLPVEQRPGEAATSYAAVGRGRRATRETITRLQAWAEQAQRDIAAADGKASMLLGWSGTALALLVTLLFSAADQAGLVVLLTGIAGAVLLACCGAWLVLAIRPQLSGQPTPGSFVHLADLAELGNLDEVVDLAEQSGGADPMPAAFTVARLSQIAATKHYRVRRATSFLLAALAPLALSVAAAVLAVRG